MTSIQRIKSRHPDWILITVFLINFFLIEGVSTLRRSVSRTDDASNLRQICQSTLLYANDHNNQLPSVSDIWDYAYTLAKSDILYTASVWFSKADPAVNLAYTSDISVLTSKTDQSSAAVRTLNPAFRMLKPSFAVALGNLHTKLPATTPICWTRGLQPDGTWAKDSPYAGKGGHIAFLDGSIMFFNDLNKDGRQLVRFDGKGPTANILEALPPGSRIGEYQPSLEEKTAWLRIRLWKRYSGTNHTGVPAWWAPFLFCLLYRLIRRKRDLRQVAGTLGGIAALEVLLIWITF